MYFVIVVFNTKVTKPTQRTQRNTKKILVTSCKPLALSGKNLLVIYLPYYFSFSKVFTKYTKIFCVYFVYFCFDEPFIPENGMDNKDWKNNFQLTLPIQDELKPITTSGNIFLTNIHRVFFNQEPQPSVETKFLGVKPKADADTSKGLDLGKILRSDKIKDLVVLNDEAHHIHDSSLQWFKSIEDMSNKLKLKNGNGISLQADYSAIPKHNDGNIFVQTICDYLFVEAIKQNVVKSPVLPDQESGQKIKEKNSSDFVELA